MFIGEVSKKTGLSVKAIRLYEEKELIRSPVRRGRYRVYTDGDIEVLRLIVEAKSLGVSLAKLKGVIAYRNGKIDWNKINQFLHSVKEGLEAELLQVSNNIKKVNKCMASIDSCSNVVDSTPKGRE